MSTTQGIPQYKVLFTNPKQHNYCVIVFVLNEIERLPDQLRRMQNTAFAADVIVADGGSTDGSADPAMLTDRGVNSLLVKDEPGKLGTQMRMAFAWALERNYAGVVVIDGNGKDGVDRIGAFLDLLEDGYDHVQGSRFIEGGKAINTPVSRYLGVRLVHAPIMRLASGFPYTDTTNGFRAYSARLLNDERLGIFRPIFTGYELHYYIALRAAQLGFRCCETPVTRAYPKGRVPTKISPIRGNANVLDKLFRTVLGHYNVD